MLEMIREFWSSACENAPKRPSCIVADGHFVFTITGNREKWGELCQLAGVPSSAETSVDGDVFIAKWPIVADQFFGAAGPLASVKANYEPRQAQINMARLVQRTIEMNDCATIEAGTGTGKGFAYLVPALAMKKRVIVSTSNKALQSQLMDKDLPFLMKLFPGRRVALAQGKSNYACRAKVEELTATKLTGELAGWYASTQSGNLEEITFELTDRQRLAVAIDDECPGQKACPFGHTCFYYKAKAERQTADVVVTNHALLALHQAFPAAELLPHTPVVVVDEAHKLADYARNILGNEITDAKIRSVVDKAEAWEPDTTADKLNGKFVSELSILISKSSDPLVTLEKDQTIATGVALAMELGDVADRLWDNEVMPTEPEQKRMKREADRIRKAAEKITAFCLPPVAGYTRWIERYKDGYKLVSAPYDVAPFLSTLVGYETTVKTVDRTHCARCGRELTAQVVNVLEGLPYGPDCIKHVDPFGDADQVLLADWLGTGEELEVKPAGKHATIFCSATLAAPTMAHFWRDCGIRGAMQMIAQSPFDYARNALLYVPTASAPAPSDAKHQSYILEEMERLVTHSNGSAFLLFTSNANLREAARVLGPIFRRRGFPVYIQGDGLPKLEMARRFAEDGNAVLFGTKSFFEGVSIEGDALRLVVLDKMPFQAPHPITTALEADLIRYARADLGMTADKAEWYPFDALRLPNMVIDLKQAYGRLIRTVADYGTVAILDTRLRTARYGRNIIDPKCGVLPPARQTHDLFVVADFYQARKPLPDMPTYTPPARPKAPPVTDFTVIEEMAF